MGIPESGDGKSDLLQEAKWEADFLAKMQDDDGGFYFLVYPKERRMVPKVKRFREWLIAEMEQALVEQDGGWTSQGRVPEMVRQSAR